MIEVQQIRALSIQLQDDDIDVFISLLEKLLIASKQVGFKKPFTDAERNLIFNLSNNFELEQPEEIKIMSEKEQVRED